LKKAEQQVSPLPGKQEENSGRAKLRNRRREGKRKKEWTRASGGLVWAATFGEQVVESDYISQTHSHSLWFFQTKEPRTRTRLSTGFCKYSDSLKNSSIEFQKAIARGQDQESPMNIHLHKQLAPSSSINNTARLPNSLGQEQKGQIKHAARMNSYP
jgi:hypothetical protein